MMDRPRVFLPPPNPAHRVSIFPEDRRRYWRSYFRRGRPSYLPVSAPGRNLAARSIQRGIRGFVARARDRKLRVGTAMLRRYGNYYDNPAHDLLSYIR